MYKYVLFAIIILFTVLFTFSAAKASRCETAWYPEWKEDVRLRNINEPLVENYLSDIKTLEFISAYNESPPKSNKEAKNVSVWIHMSQLEIYTRNMKNKDGTFPNSLVVWIDDKGCILETEIIPILVMNSLLKGVPYILNQKEGSY